MAVVGRGAKQVASRANKYSKSNHRLMSARGRQPILCGGGASLGERIKRLKWSETKFIGSYFVFQVNKKGIRK